MAAEQTNNMLKTWCMVGHILTNTEYAKMQQWQLNRAIKYAKKHAKKLGEKLSKAENLAKAAEQKTKEFITLYHLQMKEQKK